MPAIQRRRERAKHWREYADLLSFAPMLTPITYRLLSRCALPLYLGGFYLRALRQPAYRERLDERRGRVPPLRAGGVLLHAASMGEVLALRPLVEALLAELGERPLTLTTFTPAGSAQVQRCFGDRVQHCYLPWDTPGAVTHFLDALRPDVLVLMETELWPNLILQSRARGTRLCLINARLSPRSFPRYQRLRSLISPVLQAFDAVLSQSPADSERFLALGARASAVQTVGNLKYDLQAPADTADFVAKLREALGERPLVVIGSSHEDEEALLLDTIETLQRNAESELLVALAPRHHERVKPLEKALRARGLSYCRRSEGGTPDAQTRVWLIDTMGELLKFYAAARLCVVAGSFGATGGHNPLEPALFGKAVVVGSNMSHFHDIHQRLSDAQALVQLRENTAPALAGAISTLLNDHTQAAQQLGMRALAVLEENQGASARVLACLKTLYQGAQPASG